MRKFFLLLLIFGFFLGNTCAQEIVRLYTNEAPGSEAWDWHEGEMVTPTHIAYNVVNPSLTAYFPDSAKANGTALIVCPGGAFHTLSMESEGIAVAKWLNERGVAVFVLKYRLVRSTTDNPIKELAIKMRDQESLNRENAPVVEMAIADGKKAIEIVRQNALKYNINPERIGIMGFSAGGTVALGAGLTYTKENRPDFLAPIYAYTIPVINNPVPEDAPPIFICAATDDTLGFAILSSNLYNQWISAGKSAEIHIYSKGGHGFGMTKRRIPSAYWIERFGEWLGLQGLLKPT